MLTYSLLCDFHLFMLLIFVFQSTQWGANERSKT